MRRIPVFLSTLALSGGLLVALSPTNATIAPTPASMNSVSTEGGTTVVIGSDGKPYGTGVNTNGNIGTNGDHDVLAAIDNPTGGADLVAVATGSTHTVAIGSDGRLYGLGSNEYGQAP